MGSQPTRSPDRCALTTSAAWPRTRAYLSPKVGRTSPLANRRRAGTLRAKARERTAAHPVIPAKAGPRLTTHPCHSREGGNPEIHRMLIPAVHKGRSSKPRVVSWFCALSLRRVTPDVVCDRQRARRRLQSNISASLEAIVDTNPFGQSTYDGVSVARRMDNPRRLRNRVPRDSEKNIDSTPPRPIKSYLECCKTVGRHLFATPVILHLYGRKKRRTRVTAHDA